MAWTIVINKYNCNEIEFHEIIILKTMILILYDDRGGPPNRLFKQFRPNNMPTL